MHAILEYNRMQLYACIRVRVCMSPRSGTYGAEVCVCLCVTLYAGVRAISTRRSAASRSLHGRGWFVTSSARTGAVTGTLTPALAARGRCTASFSVTLRVWHMSCELSVSHEDLAVTFWVLSVLLVAVMRRGICKAMASMERRGRLSLLVPGKSQGS